MTTCLELVNYAQMLQPAMLPSVNRSRLRVVLKARLKAQVVFPTLLHFLLVQKELEHLAPSAEKRRGNMDPSWVKGYIEVASPWPTPAQPKKAFDLLRPRLCDIDVAPSILLGRMDKCFVEQVLLPAILDDPTTDASNAALKNIVEASYNHFKMVDMVSVGMHEAETLSELLDTL